MKVRLTDYKVLTFDCYGTLIDWESGIWDALQPLLAPSGRLDIPRERALEAFAKIESEQESETPDMPYPQILANVHSSIAAHFKLETTLQLDKAFGNSVPQWPAYPDSADTLRYLKKRYKLAILSNVNRNSFIASNRKLGVTFDAIFTAEDIGSYKPNPANFEYMLKRLREDHGFEQSDVLHIAQSLYHDHVPAKDLGIANVWIDRQHLSESGGWGATERVQKRPKVDAQFFSMLELAKSVKDELL